ncbi:Signal transducing adapter molecule 2 [Entophlyctis luteolus]|nr:Signal transducing adapter molecule 2 [Entophlyctis luteolus]KAJ3388024.1 Signal transducing adapter molecule 2 [Entophlyctis sp. JEL0112]
MNIFKGQPKQPTTVTAVARDTEPVNKACVSHDRRIYCSLGADSLNQEFRDHLTNAINAQVSALADRGWIAQQTIDVLTRELRSNNIELNLKTHFSSTTSSNPVGPPLPTRGPSSPNTGAGLHAPALPLRKPSLNPSTASTLAPYTPLAQGSASHHVTDAFQNPALQKAVFTSATSAKGTSSVAGDLASNPVFQRAAVKAAKDPAVQALALNAAKDQARTFGSQLQAGAPKAKTQKKVVGTADFDPVESGDLSVRVGDLITVLDEVDANWYRGSSARGTGIFPKNYVQEEI